MAELLRAVRNLARVPAAIRMVRDPELSRSYFPDEPRKSAARIMLDNVRWTLRYGEADPFYFLLGLDRQHGPRPEDTPGKAEVKRRRDVRNRCPATGLSYRCILADKELFGRLAVQLGYPVPRLLAMLQPAGVRWDNGAERGLAPLDQLAARELDAFCKPATGTHGAGAFALQARAGRLAVNGEPATADALRHRLAGRYLLQERLVQHPVMAALHPASVNTLRLVTIREPAGISVLFSGLRIGVGGSYVDNWSAGGLFVRVDLEAGSLAGPAVFKPGYGTRTGRHPDTGVELDGYRVPFLREAVALASSFHRDLPVLHTIGWDLAFTPSGPVFVEGNDDWGGRIVLALDPDCRQRFPDLYGPPRDRD